MTDIRDMKVKEVFDTTIIERYVEAHPERWEVLIEMAKKQSKPAPKPKTAHQNKGKVKKNNPTAKVLKRQAQGVGGKGKK